MTRRQVSTKIRDNLNDSGVTYYTESDINEAIQDIYDEIVVYCQCIEKSAILTLQNNTTYYDLSTLIPDYYRVIKIWSPDINEYICGSSDRDQLNYRQDWELGNFTPREFTILGPKYLGIAGRSSTATGTFQIWYKATAPLLNDDNNVFLILDNFTILLENGVTAELLEQNQEYVKAKSYRDLYDSGLDTYREKIKLLAKADRVFTRPTY